jgi:hypothetical protein
MGTILHFTARRHAAGAVAGRSRTTRPCDVVIFPGVRIERQAVDLSYRLRDTAGRGAFVDIAGSQRRRKTS